MATGGPNLPCLAAPPPPVSGLMKGSSCVDVVMLVSAPQTPPQNGPTRWLWTIYGLVLFVITKEIFRVSISDFISPFFTIVFAENCNILYKFGKNSWFVSGFFLCLFLEQAFYLLKYFIPTVPVIRLCFLGSLALA